MDFVEGGSYIRLEGRVSFRDSRIGSWLPAQRDRTDRESSSCRSREHSSPYVMVREEIEHEEQGKGGESKGGEGGKARGMLSSEGRKGGDGMEPV